MFGEGPRQPKGRLEVMSPPPPRGLGLAGGRAASAPGAAERPADPEVVAPTGGGGSERRGLVGGGRGRGGGGKRAWVPRSAAEGRATEATGLPGSAAPARDAFGLPAARETRGMVSSPGRAFPAGARQAAAASLLLLLLLLRRDAAAQKGAWGTARDGLAGGGGRGGGGRGKPQPSLPAFGRCC